MEVSEQIIKVLDNLGQKFGIAVDWTQQNITPYIQELAHRIINYEIWISVIWIMVSIGMIIFALIVWKKREFKKIDWDRGDGLGTGVFVFILIALGLIISITQIFDIVTCLTLPEKIWMDYIQIYMPQ